MKNVFATLALLLACALAHGAAPDAPVPVIDLPASATAELIDPLQDALPAAHDEVASAAVAPAAPVPEPDAGAMFAVGLVMVFLSLGHRSRPQPFK